MTRSLLFQSMAASAAVLGLALPARAEVVTLLCSVDGQQVVFDIDMTAHTARTYLLGGGRDVPFQSADFSDQYVVVQGIKIDRRLGIADFGGGTFGKCERSGKPLL